VPRAPLLALACLLAGCADPVARAQPPALEAVRGDAPGRTPAIERPAALRPFFGALARTEREGAIARVTHMGDSSIGLDDFPNRLRGVYQRRHGDAGIGFVLLQPHTRSYLNRGVWLRPGPEWELCFIIRRCARDGHYGLGGVTVSSRGGARTVVAPRDGRAISRAELWYAAQPRGGRIDFRFGRSEGVELRTRADALEDRWHTLRADPGEHAVQVAAAGGGLSRAYGVVLENDGPGVVWDTLSMIGAFTHRLLEHDEDHFAAQLAHRAPDLVVLSYGGNDLRRVVGGIVDEDGLFDETARLLERVRRAAPAAGCLLIGINDHELSGPVEVEPAHVRAVVRAQRRATERAGCAYYDVVAAMGGPGSFERWRRRGLASSDGKHLAPRGRQVIADRLVAALDHASGH